MPSHIDESLLAFNILTLSSITYWPFLWRLDWFADWIWPMHNKCWSNHTKLPSFTNMMMVYWILLANLSLSWETDVTVNLTTFEELLVTMMMTQKISKSRWMDPSNDWGQSGGYDMPKVQGNRWKQGEMGNLGLQKGELPKLLCVRWYE